MTGTSCMHHHILLCPNFAGSDEAPATAKRGEEKKVFTAVSMLRMCAASQIPELSVVQLYQ